MCILTDEISSERVKKKKKKKSIIIARSPEVKGLFVVSRLVRAPLALIQSAFSSRYL